MAPISRRQLVKDFAAAPLITGAIPVSVGPDRFQHGVASGDPDHSSVLLWTRITTGARVERLQPKPISSGCLYDNQHLGSVVSIFGALTALGI